MDRTDAEAMAIVFIQTLDLKNIPYQHYGELYNRIAQLRASRTAQGLKTDEFSADLMLACWDGLASDIARREREHNDQLRSRYLPPDPDDDQCPRCFMSFKKPGIEVVPRKGARTCYHKPLTQVFPCGHDLGEHMDSAGGFNRICCPECTPACRNAAANS
jgi:hypothetical protein